MRKTTWIRLFHYEFWPFWVFYIPAYFYYFFLAIKSRKWVYFSVLNPCMNFGGAFLSSKNKALQNIPKEWVPKTLLVNPEEDFSRIKKGLQKEKIKFPLIVKPDMGERGKGVEIIPELSDLENHIAGLPKEPYLIQEYIEYSLELGILFYWDLEGKPQISSIGSKSFCHVIGNGKDPFKALVKKNPRLATRIPLLEKRFKKEWETILPKDKHLLIEPIGNHNRGTTFLDGRNYYSKELLDWTANCARQIPGFDYGRFDIKIKDKNAFKRKKNIKIMEVNGVNSEPIHIYDPNYSIWNAYRDIFFQMKIIFDLSQKRLKKEYPTQSLFAYLKGTQQVLGKKMIH
jgi:hypothetical protein